MRRFASSLIVLAAVFALASAPAAADDWVGYRGSPEHNIVREQTLNHAPTPLWSSEQSSEGDVCVTVVGDRVFTTDAQKATRTVPAQHWLIALDANDGAMLWRSPALSLNESCPAADAQRVYLDDGTRLRAFDGATGADVWSTTLPGVAGAATLVDGTLYASAMSPTGPGAGTINALDAATGEILWQTPGPGNTTAPPLVSGNVVVQRPAAPPIATSTTISAVDRTTGDPLWTIPSAPVRDLVARGGRLYVAAKGGTVDALERETGALLWRHATPDPLGGISLAADDGQVYVATQSTTPDGMAGPGITEILSPTSGQTLVSVQQLTVGEGPYRPFGRFGVELLAHNAAFDPVTGASLGLHQVFEGFSDGQGKGNAVVGTRVYGWSRLTGDTWALVARDASLPVFDGDGDGVVDGADNCPATPNADQADADGDGTGDACDPDRDGDGVADAADNCADLPNADQANGDGDALGDACDPDRDGDTVANEPDNCPDSPNADQADTDGDGLGDLCDADRDGDAVPDESDNCPAVANAGQADADFDGTGDACDADRDGDTVANGGDNCPDAANAGQEDWDRDGQGDACDADRPPAEQLGDEIDAVGALPLPDGTKRSLSAKLSAALAAYNAGDTATTCGSLSSFEHEVRAQSGKKIPAADAERLLTDAERLAAAIGC